MAINLAVFPPGRFERVASVIADPVQVDVIHKSLKSLRIMSTMEFFTRVGVNLLFCLRLYRVVGLVRGPTEHQRSSSYPKRNWMSVTFFFLFVVLLNIWVEESMRTSTLACQLHTECVVKAHRWTTLESDSLTQCPCLTLIDVDVGSKTYAEWMQPKNVTDKGTSFSSLTSLPDGLFDDMAELTFLFLGGHFRLQRLPSFNGLTNLKALTIAALVSLADLPAFDHQQHLERLVMVSLASIDSLPDLGALTQLTSLTSIDRGTWCCNGFLGECDLTNPMCGVHPLWRTPAASCLPANRTEKRATAATLAVIYKFTASVCREMFLPSSMDGLPTEAAMDQCNGMLYKQCDVPGYPEAMCYNARLMGITCSVSPFPIEMRRRQIQQGVGDACHLEYEAWLGCH
ncbi:hypothetical protein BBJ28_00012456 [Nothophytophthora sp. Chile5]|nr:hypothetical protein BBJ28_00012456 [Nothophytophthora sp. Chile5]